MMIVAWDSRIAILLFHFLAFGKQEINRVAMENRKQQEKMRNGSGGAFGSRGQEKGRYG